MKATTLNNCNKRQQSGRQRAWSGWRWCDVATTRLEDAPPRAWADMSSTCRRLAARQQTAGRRSTKSIPGILLLRSCLSPRGCEEWGLCSLLSDWSAAVYGLMQPIQMQLRCTRGRAGVELAVEVELEVEVEVGAAAKATRTRDAPSQWTPAWKAQNSTHTAFWKLENYFHGSSCSCAWIELDLELAEEQPLRLVSKRHKRVLY